MYISASAVCESFQRLKASVQSGKSFQEKTSSLMYFLAFDVLSKKNGSTTIDFPPKSHSRRDMALEFSRFVLLKKQRGITQQIAELGVVELGGRDPEKKISSNFYTVPLKKASENPGMSPYPNRPAPLLQLGTISSNCNWSIMLHPNWKSNLPIFLQDVTGNSPFTDLAVLVCRNDQLDDFDDWRDAIFSVLKKKFTAEVAAFWIEKIESEKLFVKHLKNESFFSAELQTANLCSGASRKVVLRGMKKDDLVNRVLYLEDLLDKKSITYSK